MDDYKPERPFVYFPLNNAKFLLLMVVGLLAVSIPLTVFLVSRQQTLEQEAAIPINKNIGLVVKPPLISVTIGSGQTAKVADVIATGATSYQLYGYPTTFGPQIRWTSLSGNLQYGQTVALEISVSDSVLPGTYTGTGIITNQDMQTKTFPVTIVVP